MGDGRVQQAPPATEALAAWVRHLAKDVDPGALREELVAGSLPRAFAEAAARDPDRAALRGGGIELSYGELEADAGRIGAWLRARGVRPGDRVLGAGERPATIVLAY